MSAADSNLAKTAAAHGSCAPLTGSAALDVIAASDRELERGVGAEPVSREVVRLSTSCWRDKRGLHIRRSLITLKRQSSGYQILEEDCSMIGADEVVRQIVNLDECADGVYLVVTCNGSKDWETGYIDSYDYKLLPFGGGGESDVCGSAEKQPNGQAH